MKTIKTFFAILVTGGRLPARPLLALLALGLSTPGSWGQLPANVYLLQSGSLAASSSSCAVNACVSMPVVTGAGVVAVQLAGSFSATVQFEGSVDGANYTSVPAAPIAGGTAVTSATSAGIWQVGAGGLRSVRARVSSYTSGTVTATLTRSSLQALTNTVQLGSALSVTSLSSSGPVSATSVVPAQTPISYASSVTFNAANANSFEIALTGNSTLTVTNAAAGQIITAVVCQDGTGSRTWTWPANFKGAMTIAGTASKCNAQSFVYDGTTFYALAAGSTGM